MIEDVDGCDIINIKMRRNPDSAALETYELKVSMFKNVKLEEFIALIKNFKTAIDGTITISVSVWINYLHNMLRGESLRKFKKLAS